MNVLNKIIPISIGIIFLGMVVLVFSEYESEPEPPVTQQDLRNMIDNWMEQRKAENYQDDTAQRLEIMKAFYTFEESGQQLSDDQAGRVMLNQIRKMVSFDIPKNELDKMKQNIREELKEIGFKIES